MNDHDTTIAQFLASSPGYIRIDVDARQEWATTLEQLATILEMENDR